MSDGGTGRTQDIQASGAIEKADIEEKQFSTSRVVDQDVDNETLNTEYQSSSMGVAFLISGLITRKQLQRKRPDPG